jgi:16S rRNA (guanine966-N2)-methyltransferase
MAGQKRKGTQPGFVRIIGGTWRRRRIALPRDVALRPTPDRVRETLFNWLAPVLPGAECLDLYAGTGVLGFEALSRGAGRAVLVERDRQAALVDPPFADPVDSLLPRLKPMLKPRARVYLERALDAPWPEAPGYSWLRRSRAGAVAFGLAIVGT